MTREEERLKEARERKAHWRRWGPYVAERQWGTVREDYSAHGTAWDYFTHDQSRSRAYRWGEDGIAGISDNHQRLCFSFAFWNGSDPILKERLFGLGGPEGNHGEDVKEYYFYLDNTPTHSYMKYLYKYPHAAFPYSQLVHENRAWGRAKPEYELIDTDLFANNNYFDIFVEYAKCAADDIFIRLTVFNRGQKPAPLTVLPTLWFRNTWSWRAGVERPEIYPHTDKQDQWILEASHASLGKRYLHGEGTSELLFTENETNYPRIFGLAVDNPYFKDAFSEYLINHRREALNPLRRGSKAGIAYQLNLPAEGTTSLLFRLSDTAHHVRPLAEADRVFSDRLAEADDFYATVCGTPPTQEMQLIQRQALAGLLWNKQFYHYVVDDWLSGDPLGPPPPAGRENGRNREWKHVYNDDILSMPDKWEYPWFAAWDTAFHVIPLAMIDPDFAKKQLVLLTREWYMHPNGQIPAYEWAFDDVNPPVHAWAAWRVYKIDKKRNGKGDRVFLERVFQKLLLNFTWWVNRKDPDGNNVFQGGFLGLDNIGVFDRSAELPTGGYIQQSDGTSWMGMYCLNMLTMALELAQESKAYEDMASKFFEHFLYIADSMHSLQHLETGLWDPEDKFYYDHLHLPDGKVVAMKVRSMVGLIPLFAVQVIEPEDLQRFPSFNRRLQWFIDNRVDLAKKVASMVKPGTGERRLLAIVDPRNLTFILRRMLDETEFLSPYGIRSLSKAHAESPYVFRLDGLEYAVGYEPAESRSGMFGGNSNWRGPIWFPVNYLIIEALQRFHYYLGDSYTVECPTGSGRFLNLWQVAAELSHRLMSLFFADRHGVRAATGHNPAFTDVHWRDHLLFHEYFHGDTGLGLGANHQTGWTGLVAKLIQQSGGYSAERLKGQEESS